MFQFEVDDPVPPDSSEGGGGVPISNPQTPGFSVGDRIHTLQDPSASSSSSLPELGTVLYVGEVEGYQGPWVGVEWDNPSRGKHSGSLKGKTYFSTEREGAGSFIRPGKVRRVRGLLEALTEKYDVTENLNVKSIEGRLEERIRGYGELKIINLGSFGICGSLSTSDISQVLQLCPLIQVVEVNDNFISDWTTLSTLLSGWKGLRRIDLSRNPLKYDEEEIIEKYPVLHGVEGVALGGLSYTWEQILKVSTLWPNVVELTLPYNHVSEMSYPIHEGLLRNLKKLDLEKNKVSKWTEVVALLDNLPTLEHLNLSGNQIKSIRFLWNGKQYPKLKRLNLTDNFIDDWMSVNELDKIGGLHELRIDTNPVLNHYIRTMNRQIIIAKLPGIKKLEGADVNLQERREAEWDYVKLYSEDWSKAKLDKKVVEFLVDHPKYQSILKKLGVEEDVELNQPKAKKSPIIQLTIVLESGIKGKKEVEKKILKTMTVQKLKALLQRTFTLPSVRLDIVARSVRNPEISFPLDEDLVEVGQYSLEDGDTLFVNW